ncbi:uncharacterized protein LOC110106126 isoform X1 [Dendrobium catenatum]|uniref:uncharacterized protein LOC110106126 isoform X1 n=1 Tax=Dendrobium catenatum TaxID=906689 RepID=UPI0009F4D3B0|nr:uncharacterized protein LOC110106126 isoform X1 [Dendrobium catenatum]
MVSDQVLANCVESLVREGGAASITSLENFIRQLEAKLGMDLSSKASFINEQIYILLGPHFPQVPTSSSVIDAADSSHFTQIPAASCLFDHIPRQPNVPSFRFTAPMALVAATHQEHLTHHQYNPATTAAPDPAPARAPVASPKESAPAAPKRRGGPGGLSKVCGVTPELQTIVGEPTMARTEIVKQLWAYIRRNNLQDPNNKRKIICNDELRLVFETDSTDMFKMNKLLAKHIIPLEHTKEPGSDSKRQKKSDREVGVEPESQGGQYLLVISDGLAEFLGTGEREILQSEALKRVWDYIEANHLEVIMPFVCTILIRDHRNSMIMCDTKLQRLFACESISASGVSKMLAHHLFKQS